MARYQDEIEQGQLRVLFVDECHLQGGDIEGYVWGKRGERIDVPVVNERDHQTYYGGLDLLSKRLLLAAHPAGNTTCTIAYLRFLQHQFAEQRLLVLWDGASYHRSKELQAFLAEVNQGGPEAQWRVHCIRFAPNQPSQNPIEDVWLQGKTWLRSLAGLKPGFTALKALFEQFFKLDIFDFPKLHQYGQFS